MKQLVKKLSIVLLSVIWMAPSALQAQNEVKEKREAEQIVITRKGHNNEKVIVEVTGDKVLVNGKEIKDQKGDITVRRHKIKDVQAFVGDNFPGSWAENDSEKFRMFNFEENRALLGVVTDRSDKGVEIQSISKESAAEKAGLKKGDVITKIVDRKIENPDDLSKTIKEHKPGDKIKITFLRDKKEQNVTAELGKWKGARAFSYNNGNENFNMNFDENMMPKIHAIPRIAPPFSQSWSWSGGSSKLGLSVQDTEDGKGVNVIQVDEDGNAAKAGILEEDVITEVDGKQVNGADEIAKLMKENKDKASVKLKLLRNGKTENVEVKIPRKLKTVDL